MSALTPEEFRLLSEGKRVDVLELEIAYSLKLLELSKIFNFESKDIEENRRLSDDFDRGWREIMQERDSKIRLLIDEETL
jgi:hypothetical protein